MPTQTYPAGLEADFIYIHNVCVCVCVGGGGSSTRKTLVCANSEYSRESVRSLESALICADFYNSSKSKYILHLLHV